MRKFGVLGAALFALLVTASPVMAATEPVLTIYGRGDFVGGFTIPTAGTYWTVIRYRNPTDHRCWLRDVRVDDLLAMTGLRLQPGERDVIGVGATDYTAGRHRLVIDTGCAWKFVIRI